MKGHVALVTVVKKGSWNGSVPASPVTALRSRNVTSGVSQGRAWALGSMALRRICWSRRITRFLPREREKLKIWLLLRLENCPFLCAWRWVYLEKVLVYLNIGTSSYLQPNLNLQPIFPWSWDKLDTKWLFESQIPKSHFFFFKA